MQRKKVNAQRKRKVQIVKRPTAPDEVGVLGRAIRNLGSLGGGMLGGLVGAPGMGASAGNSLGAAVSKWLGAGDYTVSRNSIVMKASNNIPMMHNTGQSVIVRHREFVGQIKGSTTFTVQNAYELNPGLPSTFPWLAPLANRFQEYEFKGLVWHYVPTSGTFNGSSAALGSVMLQTTYRSTDTNPQSKAEMMNEYCATEVVPYETMAHPVECDPKENPFNIHYVRNVAISTGEPLMYDLGKTFVATQGMSTSDYVGDLWVTYEVELKKPIIATPVIQNTKYYGTTFTSPTTTIFFGGTQGSVVGSMTGVTCSGNTITIKGGNTVGSNFGLFYVSVTLFASSGFTHASQVSWAQPSMTGAGTWPFDGQDVAATTVVTGTNPAVNCIVAQTGFYFLGPDDVVLTYPAAQWTGGTPTKTIVVITRAEGD